MFALCLSLGVGWVGELLLHVCWAHLTIPASSLFTGAWWLFCCFLLGKYHASTQALWEQGFLV